MLPDSRAVSLSRIRYTALKVKEVLIRMRVNWNSSIDRYSIQFAWQCLYFSSTISSHIIIRICSEHQCKSIWKNHFCGLFLMQNKTTWLCFIFIPRPLLTFLHWTWQKASYSSEDETILLQFHRSQLLLTVVYTKEWQFLEQYLPRTRIPLGMYCGWV